MKSRNKAAKSGYFGAILLLAGCASMGGEGRHSAAKPDGEGKGSSLARLREWMEHRPVRSESSQAYRQLAEQYHKQHRPEMASQLYKEALAQSPADPQLHYLLAHSLASSGHEEEAIPRAREALRLRPDYPEARTLLATMLRQSGENQEAVAIFEENWGSESRSLTDGLELARWHLARDRADLAIPILESAQRRWPGDSQVSPLLANSYEKVGRVEDAGVIWEQLVNAGEGGTEALLRLTRIREALGESEVAMELRERAQRLDPNFSISSSSPLPSLRHGRAREYPSLAR